MSPYISAVARKIWDGRLPQMLGPGELAYVITKACLHYLEDCDPGYSAYAQVVGVLETVKLELYRRQIGPYEDRKCEENGDVFPASPS